MVRLLIRILYTFAIFQILLSSLNAYSETDIFAASADVIENLKSKVQVAKLDNGLTIIAYRRGIAPIFSAVVAVGVGGVDEVAGQTGISHMLEHMAFKGSPLIGGTAGSERLETSLMARLEELAKNMNISTYRN